MTVNEQLKDRSQHADDGRAEMQALWPVMTATCIYQPGNCLPPDFLSCEMLCTHVYYAGKF